MKVSWNMDEDGVLSIYLCAQTRTDFAVGKIAQAMESAKVTCTVAGTDQSQITLKLDPRPQPKEI